MQNSFGTQAVADSSAATYRAVNQSPEDVAFRSGAVTGAMTGSAENMQTIMLQLANVKAELRVMKQAYDQLVDWKTDFERSHRQAQIKQAQITHAQNQQLERRLQQFVKNLMVSMVPDAVRRVVRIRGLVVHEPTMQSSTYIVPERENKGVYS